MKICITGCHKGCFISICLSLVQFQSEEVNRESLLTLFGRITINCLRFDPVLTNTNWQGDGRKCPALRHLQGGPAGGVGDSAEGVL